MVYKMLVYFSDSFTQYEFKGITLQLTNRGLNPLTDCITTNGQQLQDIFSVVDAAAQLL